MKIVLIYMLVVNALTFAVFGIDKKKAVSGAWRVRERTLFLMAMTGGSVGAIAGMYFFRHKTKKMGFILGIPLILAAQIIIAVLIKIYVL